MIFFLFQSKECSCHLPDLLSKLRVIITVQISFLPMRATLMLLQVDGAVLAWPTLTS